MPVEEKLHDEAIALLKQLIAIPSFSKEENRTADMLLAFFEQKGLKAHRHLNNFWVLNKYFDSSKPSILLNSHHDTVKPNAQYTRNPFEAVVEEGKLYGLGSNDAGGCVVSLMAAFLHYYSLQNLKYNLVIAITAEEEISGKNGVEATLPLLPAIDVAIVGEPTQMNLAVAEKGLLVLDAVAKGRSGHAAREEGDSAILKAMRDIHWISTYRFPRVSEWLGDVKMSVTVINTENKAHNIVPSECRFVIDVRVPDGYTHEEIFQTIQEHLQSEITPRSLRLRASSIDINHPLVKAGVAMGKSCYGSPTTSDSALMNFPTLKCGPGDSARSHTANEFIFVEEIKTGIRDYIRLLDGVIF
ncbi:MAG: M20 family metallo-hydrolase [Bacteroidetes bacterium]|nr:M20 family metallo-hydrolase [Bacteroidota bacterium]